jgi:hypothetical protein
LIFHEGRRADTSSAARRTDFLFCRRHHSPDWVADLGV